MQVKTIGSQFIPSGMNLTIDEIREPHQNDKNQYETDVDEYFDNLPTYNVIRTITTKHQIINTIYLLKTIVTNKWHFQSTIL